MSGVGINVGGNYNAVDSIASPYSMNGQLPPEIALKEQALNRRQQIANLLLQRGTQAPQGQMAGRFYVGPSWAQGLAQLGQAGAGAYLTHQNDQARNDLAQQNKSMTAEAIQNYIQKQQGTPQQVPVQGPGAPVDRFTPADMVAMDQSGVDPRSMAEYAGQRDEGPQPTITTMQPPSDIDKRKALVEAMTSGIPGLREFAAMQSKQEETDKQHAQQMDFLRGEKALDRDVRLQGIQSQNDIRLEQMRQTNALTQLQIDSRERAGQDATELKRELANQTAELKRMEIQARREQVQVGKTPPGYRQTPEGNLEVIPGGPADQKAQMKLAGEGTVQDVVASLRDKYTQLQEKGGITDTTKGPLGNIVAGASSSGVGQAAGKLFGTENQSLRNTIAQQRPLLLQAIMKATGMSAKQMDSNAELKLYLATATDPTLDVQTNMRALDMIEKLYGGGKGGATASAASTGPAVGMVEDGYRFKGGDPKSPESWEKVQ